MLWRSKSRALVGIDINAEEIRLLQLRKTHRGFTVERFAGQALPFGTVQDGKIKRLEIAQAVLKNLVEETQTRGCSAALALPISTVITKNITLPDAAAPNFQQHFPGLHDALCFDYVAMSVTEKKEADVLLVASRLEVLNHYLLLAEYAGLKIKIVDVDTFALARAANLQISGETLTALLNSAAEITQLIVMRDRQIIFRQHWQTTDVDLVREIKRACHLCAAAEIPSFIISGKPFPRDFLDELDIQFALANPFTAMRLSAGVNKSRLEENAAAYMLSAGLAMREAPLW